ncbi:MULTISPECIES: hypothetical protein [Actinomadura]|uniref:Uncharacterized protein n=1 Tax=Actinomadura yumaensis TaxID=111807 RepID=A0ABW2CYI9_9ACTN|nr:hypothetical protein [Actinomadura sp. J1-007]
MRLFERLRRTRTTGHRPSHRERRAAERTARAEGRLLETEQRIHELADEFRGDHRRRA